MRAVRTMPTADATLANGVSGNQSEKKREKERAAAVHNDDDDLHDSSSVIGASLLQFLPNNDNIKSTENGDESLNENRAGGNRSPKRSRSSLYGDRDRCRDEDDDCGFDPKHPSLILHGGTIVGETDQPLAGNRRQRRRTSRKRILLRGPPRSGKTCMSMNLACSKAEMDHRLPSGCVSVIVYRPAGGNINNSTEHNGRHGSSSDESDPFPLFCRAVPAQSARADQTMTTSIHVEEDKWDSDTLNRIRICRVSSMRELLEDMLVLAGKPEEEKPTRAIVIEDLDQIIESGSNPSNQSHLRHNNGKNFVAMMLKTVAIASDTALAIENKQNEGRSSLSCPNRITLLITLTNLDTRQNEKNLSGRNLRNKNGTDSGDVLAIASCIDTVVTLSNRRRGNNNAPRSPNNHTKEDDKWKIPVYERSSRKDGDNTDSNQQGHNMNVANGMENITVNSVWRAEIQERGCDQPFRSIGVGYDDNTSGVSVIDYAFVESFVSQEDDITERDRSIELRWKDDTRGT